MQNAESTMQMLKEWQSSIEKTEAHIIRIGELFGSDSDSPIVNHLDEMIGTLTRYVAKAVGDGSEWLSWYSHENGMGDAGMEVVLFGGDRLPVKSLEDLVRCLDSDRVQGIVEDMERGVAHG